MEIRLLKGVAFVLIFPKDLIVFSWPLTYFVTSNLTLSDKSGRACRAGEGSVRSERLHSNCPTGSYHGFCFHVPGIRPDGQRTHCCCGRAMFLFTIVQIFLLYILSMSSFLCKNEVQLSLTYHSYEEWSVTWWSVTWRRIEIISLDIPGMLKDCMLLTFKNRAPLMW